MNRPMTRFLREMTPSQWLVRTLVVLAAPGALLFARPAGGTPSVVFFVLVLGLSLGAAAVTDSPFGLVALAAAVLWWGAKVPEPLSPWLLAAAAAICTGHIAGVLADHGPLTLDVGPELGRRWLVRGVLVFTLAPLSWLVVRVVDDAPEQPRVWVAGLAACLVAVLAAALAFRFSPEDS